MFRPFIHAALRIPLCGAICVFIFVHQARAKIDFDRDVRPILSDNCFKCHGFDEHERKSGLRLDVRTSAVKPAKSGDIAIVPGKVDASELVRRITTTDEDDHMPPAKSGKKLSADQITTLQQWIAEGAPYEAHWSFVAPQRPSLPPVKNTKWPRDEIDYFVAARLDREGLSPAPEANRETLIRRLYLDLIGLPPSLDEIDAFLADDSPGAYEAVVDRLLMSPRYGERMALDWLDAARFADTHGYHLDSGRDMTPWRDWVIRAFNENLPFDQFTVDQLAGDILAERKHVNPDEAIALKIASGFNRNHMINYEGGAIAEEYEHAYLIDRVNTTSTVWLGLTFACAQCHDHKFDPITQKEFYEFYAFFASVPESGLDGNTGNAKPFLQLPTPDESRQMERLDNVISAAKATLKMEEDQLASLQAAWEKKWREEPPVKPDEKQKPIVDLLAKPADSLNDEQRNRLTDFYRDQYAPKSYHVARSFLDELQKARSTLDKSIQTTMVMGELDQPRDTHVHVRGLYDQLGEQVYPGVPASLPPIKSNGPTNRLALAQWLVSPDQPLTARVTVNRFWQQYFGVGLVKTAEDFGSQGEFPSHPELLDWLATEFMQSGWDVKALQKKIVMSATYRQSSHVTQEMFERDPENRLLARGPRFRLQAEFIRDQALSLAGMLDDRIGGASVSPYQPPGLWGELSQRADSANFSAQFFKQSQGRDLYRRSMYTFWKRTSPPPQLSTLDAPNRETCTVRRPRTNTPLQALVLLNDPTYIEASRHLAEHLLAVAKTDDERFRLAFRMATGRPINDRELAALRGVFEDQLARYRQNKQAAIALQRNGDSPFDEQLDPSELAAWTMVASTLLNLDETITKG
ncbi:DUF1553 domain-containing protein [bacterium]|nr:DUF1553 domain-containing protein [bacterium]